MQKGITQVFLTVLLVMIGISLTSLVYLFVTGSIYDIFPSESFNTSYQRSRACLSLENVDFNNANLTLKNCGLVPLTKFRLFIDLSEVPLSLNKLEPKESSTIHYGRYLQGTHNFIVFADYAETPLMKLNASSEGGYVPNIFLIIDSNPKYVPFDNVSKSIITVRVVDKDNNPMEGKTVQFSTSLGYLDVSSNITNESGYTTNGIKSDKEGLASIDASLESILNSTTVFFIPDYLDFIKLNITQCKCTEWVPRGCNVPPCEPFPFEMTFTRECQFKPIMSGQTCPTYMCVTDPRC